MKGKKGVAGETLTWFVALVIIFLLVVMFFFLSVFYWPESPNFEEKNLIKAYAKGTYGSDYVNSTCKLILTKGVQNAG